MRARSIVAALLLLSGVQMWLLFSRGYYGRIHQLKLLAIVVALSCIPLVYRNVAHVLDALRFPSRRTLAIASILIAAVSSIYLYFDARYQDRTFIPKYHDEFSYMIQTRHVASGRLWAPPHPAAGHFDSFQLITEPVYASIYFPGAAMLYAPGIWLGWPHWVIPLLLSGAVVGMTFRVTAELVDAVAGFLAALMLVALPVFRLQSIMVMAQVPSMFLALVALCAWLRWRRDRSTRWALLIGLALGWAIITRPLDALCVGIPLMIAMLVALHRQSSVKLVRTLVSVALAALPFLLIQLAFNRFVTGSILQSPFDLYAQRSFPQTSYGYHDFDPTVRPWCTLSQKHAYYDTIATPLIRAHHPRAIVTDWRNHKLRHTVLADVPQWLLIALMPVGLLGLTDARRWTVWLTFPLFVALYFPYTFFLPHYPLIAAPAVLLSVALAPEVLCTTWPRARRWLATLATASIAALTVSELPELNRFQRDEWFDAPQLAKIDRALENLERKPAIVLFRFGDKVNSEVEPVYNTDVVWPDLAPIIRAHDLGDEKNAALFRHFAPRSPDRAVYRYDRADDTIRYLGTVRELAPPPLPPGEGGGEGNR
jgi:hypothetical protein